MDAWWKKKWVEALRSGAYSQDRYRLRTPNGYCCLGLACEIYGKGRWSAEASCLAVSMCEGVRTIPCYGYEGLDPVAWTQRLPNVIEEDFGLSASTVAKRENMNDTGKTFAEIADWIEENL